jgi:hypothetical protein
MADAMRRLVGGLIGGAVGVGLTFLLLPMGLSLLAAAGGGVAIGAGGPRVPRSLPWTIGVTAAAMAVGVVTAWRTAPFVADPSLGHFLANLAQTNLATKIGLGITLALGLFTGGGSGPARPRSAGSAD